MTDNSGRVASLRACDSLLSFFQPVPPAHREPDGARLLSQEAKQEPQRRRPQLPAGAHRMGAPPNASQSAKHVRNASRKVKEQRLALSDSEDLIGGSTLLHRRNAERRGQIRRPPVESALLPKSGHSPRQKLDENAPNSSRSRCHDRTLAVEEKIGRRAGIQHQRTIARPHRNGLSALESLPNDCSNEDGRNVMAPPPPRIRAMNPPHGGLGRQRQRQESSLGRRSAVASDRPHGTSKPRSKEVAVNSSSQQSQRCGAGAGARRNRAAALGQPGLQTLFGTSSSSASSAAAAAAALLMFRNPPHYPPVLSSLRSDTAEATIGAPRASTTELPTAVASRRKDPTTRQPALRIGTRNTSQSKSGATMESVLAKGPDDSAQPWFRQRSLKASIEPERASLNVKENAKNSRPFRPNCAARRQSSPEGVSCRLNSPSKSPLEALEKRKARHATPPRESLLHSQRKQLFNTQEVAQENGLAESPCFQQTLLDCTMQATGSRSPDPSQAQDSNATFRKDETESNVVAMNASNAQVQKGEDTLAPEDSETPGDSLSLARFGDCDDARKLDLALNDETEAMNTSDCPESGSTNRGPEIDTAPRQSKSTEKDVFGLKSGADKQPPSDSYFEYYNSYRQYPSIPQLDLGASSWLWPPARARAPNAKDAWSDVTMSVATDKHVDCDAEVIIPSFIFLPVSGSEVDEDVGLVVAREDSGARRDEPCALENSNRVQQNPASRIHNPTTTSSGGDATERTVGRKHQEKKTVCKAAKTVGKKLPPRDRAGTGKARSKVVKSQGGEPLRRSCRTRTAPDRLGVIAVDDDCYSSNDPECETMDCGGATKTECREVKTVRLEPANDACASNLQGPRPAAQEMDHDAKRAPEVGFGKAHFRVTEPESSQDVLQHAFPLRRSTRLRDAPDRLRHDKSDSDSGESSDDESMLPLAERVKAAARNMKLIHPAVQPSILATSNDAPSRPQRQKSCPERLGFDRKAGSEADESSSVGSQAGPSSSSHPAVKNKDHPARDVASKNPRVRGKFVQRPIPSLPRQGSDLEEATDGWSSHLIRQLREAFVQVDPTSVTFWDEVALRMPHSSKTASECRDKWFSLVKTPKAAARAASKNRAAVPVAHPTHAEEDDLFNSTPMRDESENRSVELHRLLQQLPAEKEPASLAAEDCVVGTGENSTSVEAFLRPLATKPGFKSYLQGMRRDLNRSRKEASRGRSKKAKAESKPKPMALRETFQDDDVKLKVQLSPGGTLQIHNLQSGDEEEDDFWNLYEDDDGE